MFGARGKASPKQKRIRLIITACVVILCLLIELLGRIPALPFDGWSDVFAWFGMPQARVIAEGELQVHFIDVGNADCILVRQNDHNLLIDAGETRHDALLLDYFNRHGIDQLDLVIATHPHADHIGAMPAIIEHIPIERFVLSYMPEGQEPTTWVYTAMLEALNKRSVPVDEAKAGAEYELGTAKVQILSPSFTPETVEDANEISVVTRITFGEHAFLFTGDAVVEAEAQMIAAGGSLDADVLKVAHHGSKTATSPAFVKAVSPTYAVITCGENDYGHPNDEIVSRLIGVGAKIYRSDQHGDIVFVSDGQNLSVKCSKGDGSYARR